MSGRPPARALVLGGAGMLGHKLWQELRGRLETWVTLRRPFAAYEALGLFDAARALDGVDATDVSQLERALDTARPEVVFNAVGIVKQLREAHDPVASIEVNALLPHRLAALCAERGARLVHLSTDCVFSGRGGGYTDDDIPDPVDLYGRSKLLGEVDAHGSITIRTSMIGRELGSAHGLVEWFLRQRGGTARGFRRAIFSGLTTRELARVLADLAMRHRALEGVWQVSAEPISKLELLTLIDERAGLGIRLVPDDAPAIDRSLDSSRFRAATGYRPPSWEELVDDMLADPTPYDTWADSWNSTARPS